MFSIGALARKTGVKVPTIRFYEKIGLLVEPERSAGNQRRYERDTVAELGFIRHCRQLGFSIEDIRALLRLQRNNNMPCKEAHSISHEQLRSVTKRIIQLQNLETELQRICSLSPHSHVGPCKVLEALTDHDRCYGDHGE